MFSIVSIAVYVLFLSYNVFGMKSTSSSRPGRVLHGDHNDDGGHNHNADSEFDFDAGTAFDIDGVNDMDGYSHHWPHAGYPHPYGGGCCGCCCCGGGSYPRPHPPHPDNPTASPTGNGQFDNPTRRPTMSSTRRRNNDN